MDVVDSTTGVTLATDVRQAGGFLGRARGLMFRSSMTGGGLAIRPCSSIHMLFMRFAIDAIFFDKELRVTKVAAGVRPWVGVAFAGRRTVGVLELPVGSAVRTEVGHILAMD